MDSDAEEVVKEVVKVAVVLLAEAVAAIVVQRAPDAQDVVAVTVDVGLVLGV